MAEVYMAGDFRNGTTFEMDGNVFKVVEFQHVKPGKGAAFVRTKLNYLSSYHSKSQFVKIQIGF